MNRAQVREARAIALRLYLHTRRANIGYRSSMQILGMNWPHERFEFNYILGRIVELDAEAGITEARKTACRWVVRQTGPHAGTPGIGYIGKTQMEGIV